jgi:hypothetical protein
MKILALGRTTASSQLTTRIKAINAKYGPFDACLLTIEDWDPLLKEEDVDLPVPSYFIAANREFPESIDQHLAANDNQYGRNMFYLGIPYYSIEYNY